MIWSIKKILIRVSHEKYLCTLWSLTVENELPNVCPCDNAAYFLTLNINNVRITRTLHFEYYNIQGDSQGLIQKHFLITLIQKHCMN